MESIDIDDLPAESRTALREIVAGVKRPGPALAKRSGRGWIWLTVIGATVGLWALFSGFGNPYSAMEQPPSIATYAIAFGLIAWGEVLRRRRKAAAAALGFAPGVYVIGSRLVDARKRELVAHELMSQKPSLVHRYVNGGYRNSTITWHGHPFVFSRQATAQGALVEVGSSLDRIVAAAKADDMDTLLGLDPVEIGMLLAKGEREAAFKRGDRPKDRGASRTPALVALAATVVLAPATWFVRNHFALEAAFDAIHDVYQADAWERTGGDHARAYHRKMQIELTDAARNDTGHADHLRDVLARYPDAPAELKKPVEDALHARYETTRKAALAATTSQELAHFINKIYDRLEAGGAKPVMRLDVARTDNTQLAVLDQVVAEDPQLRKVMVPVAKYFSDESEMTRAASLAAAVKGGVATFFPEDVMTFDTEKTDKPAADIPAITISYVVKPSFEDDGSPVIYREVDKVTDKPKPGALQYPGVEFALVATLAIPGGQAPDEMRFTATPAPSIEVEHTGPAVGADSADNASVYHAMSQSAFDDLKVKLVGALGGKVAPAAADDKSDPCPGLRAMNEQMAACKKITAAEHKKILDQLKQTVATAADDTQACSLAMELVRAKLASAGCAALPAADDTAAGSAN